MDDVDQVPGTPNVEDISHTVPVFVVVPVFGLPVTEKAELVREFLFVLHPRGEEIEVESSFRKGARVIPP